MVKNREKRDKVWAHVSRLPAAVAMVALFSCPGEAAIKRFTDETGTLHISNEGGEGKPPLTISTPKGHPSRTMGPGAFPGPGAAPPPPPPPEPPAPEIAPEEPIINEPVPEDGG